MHKSTANSLLNFLPLTICLGLFMLPYDAIKGTMPSVYKPISVYFFLFAFVVLLIKHNYKLFIDKTTKYVCFFTLYSLSVGLITALIYTGTASYYIDCIITILLGLITFLSCKMAFEDLAKSHTADDYFLMIFKVLGIAYIIPVFVTMIDIATIYGPLPMQIKTIITSVFGGFQTGRLTGTTYEASWLSRHMLFAMFVYWYLYKRTKKSRFVIAAAFALLGYIATFSLQGIIVLLIGVFAAILLNSFIRQNMGQTIVKMIIFTVVAAALLFAFYYIVVYVLPPSYITYRLRNFIDIPTLVRTEASSFIRIFFPALNIFMWKDHFFFGNGAGSFSYFFPEYLDKYAPWHPESIELNGYIEKLSAPAGSTFASSLSQFGIIGAILYYGIFVSLIPILKKLSYTKEHYTIVVWTTVTISFLLQAGSYAYTLFWVMVAVVSAAKFTTDYPDKSFIKKLSDRPTIAKLR